MAKLKGPLLSVAAHGMIGDRLTYSQRTSGNQARYQRSNKDANSASQQTQRTLFLDARGHWLLLSDAEKELWNAWNRG